MKPLKTDKKTITFFALIPLFASLGAPQLSWAKSAPQTEIHVTLLGQPCLLQGPFDEATLKNIHSIGPAQLSSSSDSPNFTELNKEARKALEKIRSLNNLPSLLDRYREKSGKRLEAQVAFFDTIEKQPSAETFLKIGKKYVKQPEVRAFEKLINRGPIPKKGTAQFKELMDQLFDAYSEGIEPDPEEEFHRSIKKMGVQYVCSFDETEESNNPQNGGE